jgi:copper oxidase (laccase) domain-containing protein
MTSYTLIEGSRFSLLRFPGFADGFAHAFVVRGTRPESLFKPGPVPWDEIGPAIGLAGARLHMPRQVHGASVLERPSPADGMGETDPPEADALFTERPGHAVAVASADCLPILLAGSGVCAAVHAGWKGLLAGVIGEAAGALRGRVIEASAGPRHEVPPTASRTDGRIEAAIGPSIGACCFEVGWDVADRFASRFGRDGVVLDDGAGARPRIDLIRAARLALEEAGIPPGRVRAAALCTRCGGERFESYRRSGSGAGRMLAVIGPAV